jgi:hypothetical protein
VDSVTLWKMIVATGSVCPEFLPGQAEVQAEPDEGAEVSASEEG